MANVDDSDASWEAVVVAAGDAVHANASVGDTYVRMDVAYEAWEGAWGTDAMVLMWG